MAQPDEMAIAKELEHLDEAVERLACLRSGPPYDIPIEKWDKMSIRAKWACVAVLEMALRASRDRPLP